MQTSPSMRVACTQCGHPCMWCIRCQCGSSIAELNSFYGHQSFNFLNYNHDDRVFLHNSPLSELQAQGVMQPQNPHSLSNDPVAHAADTTSPHYGATVAPFPTATYLPIPTDVFQSGEPQQDTNWRSEYMLPSNNTRRSSLNHGPVVHTADTTSSRYDVTVASSPTQATYVPGRYEHSQWNTGVHEEPAQSPHDRPTPTLNIPQFTEWSNFRRHSASIQEPNEPNDQSSHSGLPLVLPRTLPSSSRSSRDPGRRLYRCADCGDILKSKQSLRDHLEAIHKKNRRFTCSACGDTFLWKQSRNRHQRTRCLAIKAHSRR